MIVVPEPTSKYWLLWLNLVWGTGLYGKRNRKPNHRQDKILWNIGLAQKWLEKVEKFPYETTERGMWFAFSGYKRFPTKNSEFPKTVPLSIIITERRRKLLGHILRLPPYCHARKAMKYIILTQDSTRNLWEVKNHNIDVQPNGWVVILTFLMKKWSSSKMLPTQWPYMRV